MKSGMNVVLNIRPVIASVIHTGAWEGPCRTGLPKELDPRYEVKEAEEAAKKLYARLKKEVKGHVKILDPICVEYDESFYVLEKEFKKLKKDIDEVDLFVLTYRVPGIEKLNNPMCMINKAPTPIDLVAFMRDEGHEAYMAHDLPEFSKLCHYLWVKKCVKNTKLLMFVSPYQYPVSVNTSNYHTYGLFSRYGMDNVRLSFTHIFKVMEEEINDKKVINEIATKISKGASKNLTKLEWLKSDVKFYLAVKHLMDKYECNAFTAPCKEMCASRFPAKLKCTPCLTHTLLKDEGCPTACEEDLNVLMSTMVFMYLTEKSVYMGNPLLLLKGESLTKDLHMSKIVYGKDSYNEELLEIRHSVPGLKMNGFTKNNTPYELWTFTHEGWGTKVQVNMGKLSTQDVTIGRFNRKGDKMIVTHGIIKACAFKDDECSPAIYLKLDCDPREYRHRLADGIYGHHQAVVFGNYVDEIKKLGRVMNFDVEVVK